MSYIVSAATDAAVNASISTPVRPDTEHIAVMMTAVWDDFHWIGPDDSIEHTLTEGNTIGLGWVVHDTDSAEEDNGGASDGGWGINPNIQMWFDCVNCSDFLLAPIDPRVDFSSIPTAVEEDSWARIKAAYIQQ